MRIEVNCKCASEEFTLRPSDMMRQRHESLLEGLSIDHSDGDFGEEPIKADYSHIKDSSSTEPY